MVLAHWLKRQGGDVPLLSVSPGLPAMKGPWVRPPPLATATHMAPEGGHPGVPTAGCPEVSQGALCAESLACIFWLGRNQNIIKQKHFLECGHGLHDPGSDSWLCPGPTDESPWNGSRSVGLQHVLGINVCLLPPESQGQSAERVFIFQTVRRAWALAHWGHDRKAMVWGSWGWCSGDGGGQCIGREDPGPSLEAPSPSLFQALKAGGREQGGS